MNRRTFIGLVATALGSTLVTLPELPAAWVTSPTVALPKIRISQFTVFASETGFYTLRRASSDNEILKFAIGKGGWVAWAAEPGNELVFMEHDPMVVEGPGLVDWTAYGDGRRYGAREPVDGISLYA